MRAADIRRITSISSETAPIDSTSTIQIRPPITFGVQNAEHEAKDWANSRFLLLLGANPVDVLTKSPPAASVSRHARIFSSSVR